MADTVISESGSHVRVAPGEEVVLRISENPTTGYHWELTRLDPPLELVSSDYRRDPAGAIGGGGSREIRIRATAAGAGGGELDLRRPWEQTGIERFTFHVTVSVG